jgi:thiamine-phosphate pyrophosphorylase
MNTPPSDACRLYLITPPLMEPATFADTLSQALDGGDVAAVQLRLKDVDDTAICQAADILAPIAQSHNVAFIMNDRPDLAHKTGCDGVHVGQSDASYAEARQLLGDQAIVGVTCHDSRHLALEAAEHGADYVAFGAFFPTSTKDTKHKPEPDILTWWSEATTVPCVAIGGITIANCPPLVKAGAGFLSVISGVWDHPDGPAAAVTAFNQCIQNNA